MTDSLALSTITPASYQPPLPHERLILTGTPSAEAIPMDVLFVGAGPAGLAGAIELARLVAGDDALAGVEIGVLEKAGALGEHNLSGAVVNPRAFRDLFPDLDDSDFPFRDPVRKEDVRFLTESRAIKMPTPPTMRNHGNYTGSICEIVRWLGEKAEAAGVNVLPGFPVDGLLTEDDRVVGVRTVPSGLGRDGEPGPRHEPAADLTARVVVLADGTRSPLARAWRDWRGVGSLNPDIYALGVKELWETKKPLDRVVHTLGWPLPPDAFGGSWMYPLEPNLVSLGLVVGLDYRDASLDVHQLLQSMKHHPYFRSYLNGGELVEWGAKTIPEGGYLAWPERFSGAGLLVTGDAAGFVDVPSLKGIHYAVQSGIFAARAIFAALKRDDLSAESLGRYDELVRESYLRDDMYRTRNMRLAFKGGFVTGGVKAALMTVTGGRFPGGEIGMEPDAVVPKRVDGKYRAPAGELAVSKVDAVFKSGNQTRDDIPSHLVVGGDVPEEVAEMYAHLCPAGVYESDGDRLVVNAPNCIDCKATDVLGPRWTPREGGSGPAYKLM
ncbi:MAG: 4Fe-4S dicluster domain-containing protein [Longimicrobiaceae bacterium]